MLRLRRRGCGPRGPLHRAAGRDVGDAQLTRAANAFRVWMLSFQRGRVACAGSRASLPRDELHASQSCLFDTHGVWARPDPWPVSFRRYSVGLARWALRRLP